MTQSPGATRPVTSSRAGVVHDHFLPYRGMDKVAHGFCNAHILREPQAPSEFEKKPWAELTRATLLDVEHWRRNASMRGLAHANSNKGRDKSSEG